MISPGEVFQPQVVNPKHIYICIWLNKFSRMDGWMKMHSYKCKNKYIIRDHKLEK